MELSYYDLVSPSPYNLNGVGHIKAVTLSEIDSLPYKLDTYLSYVNILKMDKDTYYKVTDMSEKDIDALNKIFRERNLKLTVYDLIMLNEVLRNNMFLAIDFFFVEEVFFDKSSNTFSLFIDFFFVEEVFFDKSSNTFSLFIPPKDKEGEPVIVGVISRDNFKDVFKVVLQRCAVDVSEEDDLDSLVFKNEKARRNYMKMQKGKKERVAKKEILDKFDLGNIISALASKGNGINILNIWNLSIYNLYDQFDRSRHNKIDEIVARSISIWGDKNKTYDAESWFENRVATKELRTSD